VTPPGEKSRKPPTDLRGWFGSVFYLHHKSHAFLKIESKAHSLVPLVPVFTSEGVRVQILHESVLCEEDL
jgi:hypothetical protein